MGITGGVPTGLIERMNVAQSHRGPDSSGVLHDTVGKVSLAMTRLAIQDIDGGNQPMTDSSGHYSIVFNGELFNTGQLRKRLESRGARFETSHSDTETLLLMYREFGAAMLGDLVGMFAFVIFDRKKGILFGARDGAGIKPLYYSSSGGNLVFASELKALLEAFDFEKKLDAQALFDFVSLQSVPAPMTAYRSFRKLLPGHYFEFSLKNGAFTTRQFWAPFLEAKSYVTGKELSTTVRRSLESAVERWLISDVPVAFSLSGGLDSAALVGLAAGQVSRPLDTFSLGFKNSSSLDETSLAGLVAKRWETNHHEIRIAPEDFSRDLRLMVWHLDEPYAGGLPAWFVFKEMSESFKVAVVGTGGDELFGNYGRWRPFEEPFAAARRIAAHFFREQSLQDLLKFPKSVKYRLSAHNSLKRRLFRREFSEGLVATEEYFEEALTLDRHSNYRDAIVQIGFDRQLPDEFLHMTDRFSMAHSVEARTPFLDQLLVAEVLSIPAHLRTRRNEPKYLLAEAVSDIIPHAVMAAPKKGFVLPEGDWMRGALRGLVREAFDPRYLEQQGIFETVFAEKVLNRFFMGDKKLDSLVWNLFMFQIWYQENFKSGG